MKKFKIICDCIYMDVFNNYCYLCDKIKYLDIINRFMVCKSCGHVSESYDAKILNVHPVNENLKYIYSYRRITHFQKKLNKKTLHIPLLLSGKLERMFFDIQKPFNKICKNRKNFISYNYVITKFLEILGMYDMTYFFKTSNDSLTIYKYDQIWRKICYILNWEFIQSVCLLCIINEKKKFKTSRKNSIIYLY